jgi:hypothetical protein
LGFTPRAVFVVRYGGMYQSRSNDYGYAAMAVTEKAAVSG